MVKMRMAEQQVDMADTCQTSIQRLQTSTGIKDNVMVTIYDVYTRRVATIFGVAWLRAGGRATRPPKAHDRAFHISAGYLFSQ
jgi:hypothetical protein